MEFVLDNKSSAIKLPKVLIEVAHKHWQRIVSAQSDIDEQLNQENKSDSEHLLEEWSSDQLVQLQIMLGLSDFVAESLLMDKELTQELPKHLQSPAEPTQYRSILKDKLAQCQTEDEVYRTCRRFRRQVMVTIAWRDFLIEQYPALSVETDCSVDTDWSVEKSLSHLSQLAEALICEVYHWQYQACCEQWGTPMDKQGNIQPMLILGMGKLGGGELNFSSDIDLIFTYPENGETQGARRAIDNSVFFTRLGQRIIKSLDQITADGFCYRVDMRLRPFGDSGPLVMSFSALEDYYQEQGRDWERYAMIKARVMGAEDFPQYAQLRKMLLPFVFRRYIDFSAIQSLRKMKSMIQTEVRRRGLSNNIKLGAGGIREIEFIAQSFQLIRGGREPSLQLPSLLSTLQAVDTLELLSSEEVSTLRQSYLFLRRLENLIQALADKQTQTLPDDMLNQNRLAFAMNMDDWQQLQAQIDTHMQQVNQIFADLIGEEENTQQTVRDEFVDMWALANQEDLLKPIFIQELQTQELRVQELKVTTPENLAVENVEQFVATLQQFHQEMHKKTLGPRGRDILENLMPYVLEAVFTQSATLSQDNFVTQTPLKCALERVLNVLSKIVTRTTYLELLFEHPQALKRLVQLCSASPMISEKLGLYPMLLDELIDPQHFYEPMALSDYQHELRDFLARIPEDDLEQQMEALRQFKQICLLKIAAADVMGVLPVMKVSDHLTYLAEAILQSVIKLAWQQMYEKYGAPNHLTEEQSIGMVVIGYGKMGGWELGYHSDLDLVCLHDCPENSQTTGAKSIDSRQFYLRFVQRIMHIFSTRTPSGILYEIDMRLRPSGNSGLLTCTLETFEHYQTNDAWTWEHQALTRARAICGDPHLMAQFNQVRSQILSKERDKAKLSHDIVEMRHKMIDQLANKKVGRFHLKHDRGGITDIEFLVQYWVLQFSAQYPDLLTWSDNVRIIETFAKQGQISFDDANALTEAYTSMRDEIHHRNLLNLKSDVDESRFVELRDGVTRLWQQWFS